MSRPEPYWSHYLPSWRKKDWDRPMEIKINKSTESDSTTKPEPRCEGCTWSCDHCPYSLKTLTS